jgi:hypothetical protein
MGSGIIKRAMLVAAIVLAAASSLRAQTPPTLPYEIVKDDIDMEAAPDGRFWELVEVHYRPLTSQGVEALQKITLSYTAGYESLKITAYTLKKDGRRIDIPAGSILQGHGETTSVGQTLPQTRASDYACSSGTFRDDVTTTLPASAAVANVPPGKTFTTDGAMLETSYETPAPNVVKEHVLMKLDRPGPVCRAGDYARIRPELANMVGGLMAQILYK